ncbi:hypothetical protein [Luteibacter yeojuensis]|uniref:G domain-containing protein n=1 Tax=Luteibacter yeojuensis TaxID=345309 RepID=A0A0F3KXK7_9GAMM|nr:hypothetical protein [Luteibacter yeojuensis]KJV35677.1 hypothetical protein VI08_06610 [Luteibacter yeojuensis]
MGQMTTDALNDGTVDLADTIYPAILAQIHGLVDTVSQETTDGALGKKQEAAKAMLESIAGKLTDDVEWLRKHSRTKDFTLAFYGETNAGKSTLIECLRILLGERTKKEQRAAFMKLQQQLGLSESDLQEAEARVEAARLQLDEVAAEALAQTVIHAEQVAAIDEHIATAQSAIDARAKAVSWFGRIMHLFREWPEERELRELKARHTELPSRHNGVMQRLRDHEAEAQLARESASKYRDAALGNLAELAAFEDGQIIGDGRSDFTRKTGEYTFTAGDQTFIMLDVPGIEGDEARVGDEINEAMASAHAVFYVTAKAAPPQTGETGRPGTLEKIKAHLGYQTEVWTIFNKRVTNPMALKKTGLLTADDEGGLADLNARMVEQLGRNYQGEITLSALPAYLAVADCIVPRSTNASIRDKFLGAFSALELLEKSGIDSFRRRVTGEMIAGQEEKIRLANIHKVASTLRDVGTEIEQMNKAEFTPLADELAAKARNSGRQLDIAVTGLKSRLENRGEQAVHEFENEVRRKIYKVIDRNVSNDAFEECLREILAAEQGALQERLPVKLDEEVVLFQEHVKTVVERFAEHVGALLASYEHLRRVRTESTFSLNVNIDNGINYYGILGSLVSGGLLIWNPAGWIIMSISIASLVASLIKSVWSFFNDDYKKGQQRKAADENLASICAEIRTSLRASLKEAMPGLEENARMIHDLLQAPVRQARQVASALDSARLYLKRLSTTLETQDAI